MKRLLPLLVFGLAALVLTPPTRAEEKPVTVAY